MIRVFRSGFLTFNKNKYKCSFGKNGFTKNKIEGDLKTPIGNFKVLDCFYRPDRVLKPKTNLNCKKIKKNMAWCDDPKSKEYNKLVSLPFKNRYEKLFRKDQCYDILITINHNIRPIKKNLGSAIFMHIAKKGYKRTEGCITLKKKDILALLKLIDKNTRIKIG
ncbi:MAG: transpeptidase [Pelagibacterales bacterium]|nr:transpeptidase [Pelagibacterales bacterium]